MPRLAAPPPDLSYEHAAQAQGARVIAGVDEVGRGPWAGPVTACAVILTGPTPDGLTDSKKLSAKRREALVPHLEACCLIGIGEASVAEIDALNIRQATHLAMRRAVAALPQAPDHLLIDGIDCPAWVDCPRDTIKGGDGRSLSIAAASVLAKTRRDQGMVTLAQQFPGYGWETNMGYGTAAHRLGLAEYGVTQHHRRSFAPIRNML
ncbi:ribonuclease HII [Jannaschia pagri]|uniref:Ribonuclease HII n=1 Tax=Jannaschia pagri TaxID=2829797 RepID=A0ABQ4NLR1_9RHOB|nr:MULTISPECIES: ribonuclease HII [unclassified Jannaschia]GIT91495.1 ribonuclease HII [Jannaschia sp. AI_61]GIT95329.1 ribonuclease HII [Jannaschia sp. AI_62]